MATLPALLSRLDADERVRGRQWERICAWYLTHDPACRALLQGRGLWPVAQSSFDALEFRYDLVLNEPRLSVPLRCGPG